MAKSKVDWEKVESLCELEIVDPKKIFAKSIGKTATVLMGKIKNADRNRSKLPVAVAELIDKPAQGAKLEEYFANQYITETALLRVFQRLGVLDPFFEALWDEDQHVITKEGWSISMHRPSSTGLFQVEFIDPTPELDAEVERVKYLAAA